MAGNHNAAFIPRCTLRNYLVVNAHGGSYLPLYRLHHCGYSGQSLAIVSVGWCDIDIG